MRTQIGSAEATLDIVIPEEYLKQSLVGLNIGPDKPGRRDREDQRDSPPQGGAPEGPGPECRGLRIEDRGSICRLPILHSRSATLDPRSSIDSLHQQECPGRQYGQDNRDWAFEQNAEGNGEVTKQEPGPGAASFCATAFSQ